MTRIQEKVKDIVEVRPHKSLRDFSVDPAETVAGYYFTDGTSELHLVFFGKVAFVAEQELLPGTRALFAGKVGRYRQNLQLVHPAFEILTAEQDGS